MAKDVKDRYRYFRVEARELLTGITQAVLSLEKEGVGEEQVRQVLRQAHTLKGASGVVGLSAIREVAHAIEEVLEPYRDGTTALPSGATDELLRLIDAAEQEIPGPTSELTAPPEQESTAPPQQKAERETSATTFESRRVDVADLDSLAEASAEAGMRIQTIQRAKTDLVEIQQKLTRLVARGTGNHTHALTTVVEQLTDIRRQLGDGLEGTERELNQIDDRLTRLRLLPVQMLATTLERAARDAARSVGKDVDFSLHGGEARVDAHVLAGLQVALLHLVRNAVDHGIEAAPERQAAGKPKSGNVSINSRQQGHRLWIACQDDGPGIDVEAVRQIALVKGLVSAEDARALDVNDLFELLFDARMTTTTVATQISGRGVGLDVVRETVAQLGGDVHIESEPGQGTTVELSVPISVFSSEVLRLEAGDIGVYIPMDAVHRAIRVTQADVSAAGPSESLFYEGQTIPFIPLLSIFGSPSSHDEANHAWSAVIIRAGTGLIAIGAEHLAGVRNVVIRPLPAMAEKLPVVRGAIFDSEGDPKLVLEPNQLLLAARGRQVETGKPTVTRSPLLIVDDSLTTRMLQQSVLETAGYEVDCASSAEEALQMVKRRAYGVFLVDVEMPGMNGFEFIKHTKADPELSDIPAILVTTLTSTEDRRRGMEAGAYAYIVKSEYDEKALCDLVGRLVG